MKIKLSATDSGVFELEDVYNPVVFKTNKGEKLFVVMRDGGFEVSYDSNGDEKEISKHEFKGGVMRTWKNIRTDNLALNWFIEKVGKKIYRDAIKPHECNCYLCLKCVKDGFIIDDEDHARVLYAYNREHGVDFSEQPFSEDGEVSF